MNTKAGTWLFDLGNSRVKGAWLDGEALAEPFSLAWETAGFDAALRTQLSRWPAPTRVLIASVVVRSRANRVRDALQSWPQAQVRWLRSPRRACGIINRYRIPERLGIDRFLAMAAARAAAGNKGVVVIGCGTALTLDGVDMHGVQQEGLIAPSPQLMLRSLLGATAIEDANPGAFAENDTDDTARALQQGCARAAAALVEWYHARYRAELQDPGLWLHGGAAAILRESLEGAAATRARLLDDAVLRGLALWAKQEDAISGVPPPRPPE